MQRTGKFLWNGVRTVEKSASDVFAHVAQFTRSHSLIYWMVLSLCFAVASAMHPYYVGVTEVKIDPKSKHVEMSCKLFVDDVQEAIFRSTGQKVNLSNKTAHDQLLLKNYVLSHVKVKWGNAYLNLTMLGYEIQEEGVWCYLESSVRGRAQNFTVFNRALYESVLTQTHFMHFTYGTQVQHWKITNPEEYHTFTVR